MALAFESAERDTKYIQPDGNIHLVKKPQYRQGSKAQVPHLEQNLKLEGKLECRRCGGAHLTTRCFKKEWICFVCKKPGHLANKCRFKLSMKGNNVKNVEQEKEVNCDNFDSSNIVSQLKVKYKEVFSKDRSSHILNFKAKLKLRDGATPTFHKAYSIPYSKKQEVEAELLNLVKSGIIKKVTHSDWASPIVIVEKSNKNIRVCVDYKVTLNKQLDTDHYPLPLPEDIFSELAGATCFCVLDLSGAYQQLLLDDKSQEYMTINTHLGLFRPTRLQFGVSSGPSVFQSVMDQILQNVSNVRVFIDDIIISGNSSQDCQKNLENVLQRFKQYNVRVNLEKCQFFCKEIKFLGHIISSQGIRPLPDKIEAIAKAPPPGSITQLQAYLGLLNYYGKFLPRLADHLAPLHNLLRKDVPFCWTETCNKSFELSKKLVLEHGLLVHYDCMKDLYVTADASQYGIGAVLSHKIEKEPICFASATLNNAQKNYSQVEKEALAIIFAVQKFHKYLYGRKFILVTDHQPLKFIFDPQKKIPVTANSRLQRWALILSGYIYEITYRKGSLLGNADALSRLPLPEKVDVCGSINYFNFVNEVPLSYQEIAKYTQKDPILSKVYEYVMTGWPNYMSDECLKPYFSKRAELVTEQKCVLWGGRVIIPEQLRSKVLGMFHESHQGIVQTKMLVRGYCWWPNYNNEIETEISKCDICQSTRNFTKSIEPVSWKKCENNFERVHIDFFMKDTTTYLLIVDSRSKWLDVHIMLGTSASQVIEKLCRTFAIIGIPAEIVSDNGPPFTSIEFLNFLKSNGCIPLKSPPYHPESNGMAERTVQTIKQALSKLILQKRGLSKEVLLQNFLFTYRNAPNSTGMSPNEIIFKYKPRTRFELMKPSNILSKRIVQSANNLMAQVMFKVGDSVWCKNLKEGKGWSKAFIVQCLSPVRYIISVNGVQKHYHVSDLRNCSTVVTNKNSQDFEDNCKETPVYTPVTLSPIDTNSSLNKDIEIDRRFYQK
ncbi:unnamed protein product [Arctia plantaginis]|uniref:RNA-directed DNA polymerase n=1 Tax=Arctia plantaginis TaxID=874455 RepID=A0A8S1BM55_ARCPL|nr:unnamed protein product [Arctia plantaginis]